MIIQDKEGNNIQLEGTVILAQDATDGDLLWRGTLDDWNLAFLTAGSLSTPSEVMQVKSFDWGPDVKARNIMRQYGIMRYREKIVHS